MSDEIKKQQDAIYKSAISLGPEKFCRAILEWQAAHFFAGLVVGSIIMGIIFLVVRR